jgi:DNA-binding CsgD family transcriptional regulator
MSWQLKADAVPSVPIHIATAIVRSVGSDNFAKALLRAVDAILPTSYCSIFQVAREETTMVDVAGANSLQSGVDQARLYLDSKFYNDDPIWREHCDADMDGLLMIRSAAEIHSETHRSLCYEAIGVAQRCSLIFPSGASGRIAVSFYCTRNFVPAELDLLQGLSKLLGAALAQHIAINVERSPAAQARAFLSKFNLTIREEQILLLALRGLTNKVIAKQLDLQPSTVVSYRDRAYHRLGIGRHADMVKMMLFPDPALLH